MTTALQRYNMVPRAPLTTPISAHPPAAPCGPGGSFPEGHYISRGGVFEGAQMATDDSHCGTFSDYTGKVPLRTWPRYTPGMRVPSGARVAAVPGWPPETRVAFQPRAMMLGFGNISAPGVPSGPQLMDPMRLIDNRTRAVWTGPLSAQPQWPQGATPRGGVLDGNTLNIRGQSPTSAFYHGASAQVMLPPDMINVLPNPLHQEPIPQVGWGIPGSPPAFSPTRPAPAPTQTQALVPTAIRPRFRPEATPMRVARAAVRPRQILSRSPATAVPICRARASLPELTPRPLGAGPDGLGRYGGGFGH